MTQQRVSVEVGERVKFRDSFNHSKRSTEARNGKVTKVGRVWIEVVDEDRPTWTPLRFRLDTQTDGSKIGSPARFWKLDQWETRLRQSEAVQFLGEQGISINYDSPWRGREIELADLIRNQP